MSETRVELLLKNLTGLTDLKALAYSTTAKKEYIRMEK